MDNQSSPTTIAIIDFSRFLNGSTAEQQQVAVEIGKACNEIGFYYLSNHGVSQDLIDRVFAQSRRFFALPLEEKMKTARGKSIMSAGYLQPGDERISRLGDNKEIFGFFPELVTDDDRAPEIDAGFYKGNRWPDHLPGFREILLNEYLPAMANLADKVMQVYALALHLPIDWFKPMTRKPLMGIRLAHYPASFDDFDEDRLACGRHTDETGITFLVQEEGVCGLQVKNSKDQWIDAVPIRGTILVNVGELIERWSNGHFKAIEHRVCVPLGIDRYSLIFFHSPDYDAIVEPCVKDEKPKYPAIITGDFLRKRNEVYDGPLEGWTENEQNIVAAEQHAIKVQRGAVKSDKQEKAH